jgi:hypothetical protein
MFKGYVIVAENTDTVNYVRCAEVLANSIKKFDPRADLTLISNSVEVNGYFHRVVPLPYGDLAPNSDWKLINDWQVYEASPYDYTIKLEADMFVPASIEYWWDILKDRDLVVSTTIRNFKGEVSDVRDYRRFIDNNNLPDTYNAITYFKKSELANTFFQIVRDVFENWDTYKAILKCDKDEIATTDWAYAIASHILGEENTTLPTFDAMSMVHMKPAINKLLTEDWTDEVIYECTETLKVGTYPQRYPFHYHIKDFSTILKVMYG